MQLQNLIQTFSSKVFFASGWLFCVNFYSQDIYLLSSSPNHWAVWSPALPVHKFPGTDSELQIASNGSLQCVCNLSIIEINPSERFVEMCLSIILEYQLANRTAEEVLTLKIINLFPHQKPRNIIHIILCPKMINHHQTIGEGFRNCILANVFCLFWSTQPTQTWLVNTTTNGLQMETTKLLVPKCWSLTLIFSIHMQICF